MPSNLANLVDLIAGRSNGRAVPLIVALDGRSGAGKSTLARVLADRLHAAVIEGDDFYAGGIGLRDDNPELRAAACIDWTRQRPVLDALRNGRDAIWRAFDWAAFDGRLCGQPTRIGPRPVVILEGVYAARPELADLIDLRAVVTVPEDIRMARLLAREGTIGPWDRQWHEAEDFYFENVMAPQTFDVVLDQHDDLR